MQLPGTQEIRRPLLEAFKGEAPRNFSINESLEIIAEYYGLNLNDFSSSDKNILRSRINEAKSDLKKNNLLYNPSGNIYMITNAGTEIIENGPEIISNEYLKERRKKPLPLSETLGIKPVMTRNETEILPDNNILPEPEDVEDTLPEIDTDSQPEAQLDDALPDIETPASEETLPEIDTDSQPDSQLDDAITDIETPADTEDFAGKEFDEAPEEILDTEEVYNQMPEDIYEPEETQEDLTPETELEESQPESEPEEPEHEEEYDPELLSAAIPSNSIDDVIARYNSELADELLMKAAGLPSDRFEMLVIDLLSKMGYFAFQTARYTTESSGSDMIHGVILDNKTGANIYIQARKLYPGKTIGKADIQDFIDELADKGGKGIYATTANFSENAQILAADERLMLIDGEKLANLMIANNFCVNVEKVYEIKAIDTESFSEYE